MTESELSCAHPNTNAFKQRICARTGYQGKMAAFFIPILIKAKGSYFAKIAFACFWIQFACL